MKRKTVSKNTENPKIGKRLVRQTLRGYQVMNKIVQAERRERLEHMTIDQARKIFDDLHQDADKWKQTGGDLDALERRRLASKIKGRKIFIRLARRQGLL